MYRVIFLKARINKLRINSMALCLLFNSFVFSIISCSPSIRSCKVKTTDSSIFVDVEVVTQGKDGNFIIEEPPSKEVKKKIDDRLKSVSDKYDAKINYGYSYDSLSIFWKLYVPNINNLNALIFDLFPPKDNKQFPLDLKVRTTSDSIFLILHTTGEAFIKNSLISIETPTKHTFFTPTTISNLFTPSLVAPNIMQYYFYPDSEKSTLDVICGFKKSGIPNIDTIAEYLPIPNTYPETLHKKDTNDNKINPLGIKQNYWEFWCIMIGGIASIITIIAFFKKK